MTEPQAPRTAEPSADDALARHRDALRERFPLPPPRAPRKKRAPAAAALLTILLGLVLWSDPAYRHEHYATAIGEQRQITLRDGSTVKLDTGSQLDLSWHLRSRRVALEGQAFFDVAHAACRPFRVDAGTARVRVVGTAFNIRTATADASTLVSVLRGRVAVRGVNDDGDALLLGVGEQARVRGGHVAAENALDVQRGLPWTDGRLVFDRTPLRDALAEIRRYRRTPLVLADARLGDLLLSGAFSVERSDDLLDLLPQILPVRVEHLADGSVYIEAAAASSRPPRLASTSAQ